MQVHYIEINTENQGQRLDNFLMRELKGVPKSHIYRIIRGGEVRVNKKRVAVNFRLSTGDSIRIPPIRLPEHKAEVFVGDNLKLELQKSIIYEDNEILVINKPTGIAVHGGSGLSLGIIEAFRQIRKDLHFLELIHRLDKETSGCLVLAKKRSALRAIHLLFRDKKVIKTYWAILQNKWKHQKTTIVDLALEKNTLKSGERIVRINSSGKDSITEFHLLKNYEHTCLVEVKPKTGRTHQIRVHSAHLGHPIVGDTKYGQKSDMPKQKNRLYLHAYQIQFNLNNKLFKFTAEPDEAFKAQIIK